MSQSSAHENTFPNDVEATLRHIELLILKQRRLAAAQKEATEVLEDLVGRHQWSAQSAMALRQRMNEYEVWHRGSIFQRTGWTMDKAKRVLHADHVKTNPRNSMVGSGIECVYALIEAGEVVYVGISRNVSQRFKAHRRSGNTFDEWEIYPCENRKAARDLEAVLIQQHRPARNVRVERRVI